MNTLNGIQDILCFRCDLISLFRRSQRQFLTFGSPSARASFQCDAFDMHVRAGEEGAQLGNATEIRENHYSIHPQVAGRSKQNWSANSMTMMSASGSKGVNLGSIAGIPIQLQYSCFVLVGVEVLAVMWQYHEPIFTVLMFILYGPVLLGTILIVSLLEGHVRARFASSLLTLFPSFSMNLAMH